MTPKKKSSTKTIKQVVSKLPLIPTKTVTHSKIPLVDRGLSVFIYQIPETDACLVSFMFSNKGKRSGYLSHLEFGAVMSVVEGRIDRVKEYHFVEPPYMGRQSNYENMPGYGKAQTLLGWHRMTIIPDGLVSDFYNMLVASEFKKVLETLNVPEVGIRVVTKTYDFITFL